MANPTVVRGGDLPVEERGRIRTRADLRVGDEDEFVERRVGGRRRRPRCPTCRAAASAATACRTRSTRCARRKLLAKNLVAVLRGELPAASTSTRTSAPSPASASYTGVFQSGNIALKGLIAWFAHRGYHGLAMPCWERKFRVLLGLVEQLLARSRHRVAAAVQQPALRRSRSSPRARSRRRVAAPAPAPRPRHPRQSRVPKAVATASEAKPVASPKADAEPVAAK